MDKWEKFSLADALEEATFSDGETIVQQGNVGDFFYLVIDG